MRNEFKVGEKISMWVIFLVMTVLALSILAPIIWAIYTATKGELDYLFNVLGLPKKVELINFAYVYEHIKCTVTSAAGQKEVGFFGMFFNSVLYSALDGFTSVMMPALLGYIVAKYNFKGRNLIHTFNLVVMILPIVGSLPAKLTMLKNFGIYDNLFLYVLTQNSAFGFYFLLISGAFKGLSWSYSEAAFIDGAGHLQVMFRIMFPMMMPTFAMIFILAFVSSWNTYTQFLMYLPSYPNLFLGMYYFQNRASINYATTPQVLAGLIMVAIPSAILYASSQKLLASNFVVGGLKG